MSRPLEESLARCAMTSAATGPGTLASPATGMIAQAATRRAGYLVSSCVAAPSVGGGVGLFMLVTPAAGEKSLGVLAKGHSFGPVKRRSSVGRVSSE
jgi:hypothetical protein